jgi:hypothetical protein
MLRTVAPMLTLPCIGGAGDRTEIIICPSQGVAKVTSQRIV